MSKINCLLTKHEKREFALKTAVGGGGVQIHQLIGQGINCLPLGLDKQKFNGDMLTFVAFWDHFEVVIDKDEDIRMI